jgi:GGDEF domain-containing protein
MYIKNSAKVINQAFSRLGTSYRIGGDEFATIIVGHEADEVQNALDLLYGEEKMVLKGIAFDCAFGMAMLEPESEEKICDLFDRADREMYENKKKSQE